MSELEQKACHKLWLEELLERRGLYGGGYIYCIKENKNEPD